MKDDSSCVHIVMAHWLCGIYELLINLWASIIHMVSVGKGYSSDSLSSFSLARIAKEDSHKFGQISKVVWSAVKNSYVFSLSLALQSQRFELNLGMIHLSSFPVVCQLKLILSKSRHPTRRHRNHQPIFWPFSVDKQPMSFTWTMQSLIFILSHHHRI